MKLTGILRLALRQMNQFWDSCISLNLLKHSNAANSHTTEDPNGMHHVCGYTERTYSTPQHIAWSNSGRWYAWCCMSRRRIKRVGFIRVEMPNAQSMHRFVVCLWKLAMQRNRLIRDERPCWTEQLWKQLLFEILTENSQQLLKRKYSNYLQTWFHWSHIQAWKCLPT